MYLLKRRERLFEDVRVLWNILQETIRGRYFPSVKTLIALTFALLYFILPTDALFDFIPLAGYLDDAVVVGWVAKNLREEIERFNRTRLNTLKTSG